MNPEANCHCIMLVEDNPVDLDLTLRAFAKRNMLNPIIVARDGAEALSWIARWEGGEVWPTLILLDLKLPKVDGLEVLRQLKTHPQTKTIPIVILTSSTEQRDIVEGYSLGVNGYIQKPVDFDQFRDTVKQIGLFWLVINEPPPATASSVK